MIIVNFNVLAQPGDKIGPRLPHVPGIHLWRVLHEAYRGALTVIVERPDNMEHVKIWMTRENIKAWMLDKVEGTDSAIVSAKVNELQSAMGHIDWYVDVNPVTVAETMRNGIQSLCVATPYVVRPEWSYEPSGPRPWSVLAEEVQRQRIKKNEQSWGEFD